MRDAIQKYPFDPGVLLQAAATFLLTAPAGTEALAHRAVQASPDDPGVVFRAFHRGDSEEAEKALTTAFERDPEGMGHGEVLAKFYRKQGRMQEALETVQRARAYRPDDARIADLERTLVGGN